MLAYLKKYISKNGFYIGWTVKRKAPKKTWRQRQQEQQKEIDTWIGWDSKTKSKSK